MDVIWITLAFLGLLNILVSIFLCRRDDLATVQKIAQIVIVWLVPFLGAIGLWWFHHGQDIDVKKASKPEFGGGTGGSSSSYSGSGD